MERGLRIALLLVLLLALGWLLAARLMPRLGRMPRSAPDPADRIDRAQARNQAEAQYQTALRRSVERRPNLPDGSFNPIPPFKAAFSDDPAALLASLNWRPRLLPSLAKALPPDGPAFYVYPFLDRTPQGVGVHFTYGWHLVGSAALAQWTDANLAAGTPRHYGLPDLEQADAAARPTLAEWSRTALEDSATSAARYIVVGAYDFDASARQYQFEMKLIDRQAPAAVRSLITTATAAPADFFTFAAAQRAAACQMTEALVKLGLAHARPVRLLTDEQKAHLDLALGEIARLLDAADSWAAMEGIDYALALARLYPGQSLPLQAAAYGFNEMAWSFGFYGENTLQNKGMGLQAFALSQVALAMDPRAAMIHLNWWYSRLWFGHKLNDTLNALNAPAEMGKEIPELAYFRSLILREHAIALSQAERAFLPEWMILWFEQEKYWFSRDVTMRLCYVDRIKYWADHDLYLMALLHGYDKGYDLANMRDFSGTVSASRFATPTLAAAELASLLIALEGRQEARALVELLTGRSRLDPKLIGSLARSGDFYGLRRLIFESFDRWGAPSSPGHPAYALLKEVENLLPRLDDPTTHSQTLAGYAGFEFNPAERARFNARRDACGPMLMAWQEGHMRGVLEEMLAIANTCLEARPSSAYAHVKLRDLIRQYIQVDPKIVEMTLNAERDAWRLYPLNHDTLYEYGRTHYFIGKQPEGDRYLREYARQDPADAYNGMQLGQLYRRYGLHARAVKALGEFLQLMPERYDIANERAWSLCQMGRWKGPEIRATFARPVPLLPGNSTFHEDYLTWLVDWMKEYPAAHKAAEYYDSFRPNQGLWWQARISRMEGRTSESAAWIGKIKPDPKLEGLGIARFHASVADLYFDCGRIDLAEKHVRQAEAVDAWMEVVIRAMGRLAYEKGDYAAAVREFEREYQRYGYSPDAVLWLAKCLEKNGDPAKAIQVLEQRVFDPATIEQEPSICVRLVRLYVATGQGDKARLAMDLLIKSPRRTRPEVLEAAQEYQKAAPAAADKIIGQIDQIMAGPE